ncbi:MAG: sigma 54-interacting transcriptional regulator [Deltaproteobacteria bacterium]|nr:sigma 54-interacting transcriptional regulator [Deltaproteobacteria bacterium]
MADKPTYEELEQRVRELEKEVSRAKSLEQSVQKTRNFAKSIVETIREPLVILDDKLKIVTATRSFYKSFRLTPRQIQGKLLYDVNDGQLDIPELRSLLEDIVPRNTSFENFVIEHNFENIGLRILNLNARRTYDDTKKTQFVLLAIEDVTERVHTEREILRSEARLKEAAKLALLGHWELELVTDTLYWSEEIYRMFELDDLEFGATYETFLNAVHPDDREFVNDAYIKSLKTKTSYDIVHRLLFNDGRVKYVNEKCKTEYDEDGNPLRSLGTVQDITKRVRTKHGFAGIIGRNPAMRELFDTIRELADVNVPVLVQGESGTGKELVAAAIHNEGSRAKKPFVPVNCSALPEGLLESELFGHVKGAFTGALRDKKGRFELAHGGTLFLDEIVDLPKVVQVKLLRVLQEGTFEPVGSEKTVSVDVRLISAANRDLKHEVKKGNFRDDLFYRINVVPILLPPLRERKNDIPLLIENFLEKSAQEGHVSGGISKDALAAMIDYSWPGNVRELQSAIRFALVKSKGQRIKPDHLPLELKENVSLHPSRGPSRKLSLESVRSALTQTGGNKAKAAKLLGVGRATLYRFMSEYPDPG